MKRLQQLTTYLFLVDVVCPRVRMCESRPAFGKTGHAPPAPSQRTRYLIYWARRVQPTERLLAQRETELQAIVSIRSAGTERRTDKRPHTHIHIAHAYTHATHH